MNFRKIQFYSLSIIALLSLGFYRDFLFKSINALLKAWDSNLDYIMPPTLHFFENLEYDTIVNIKWVLTLIFSLLFLCISLVIIKYKFKEKTYLRITFYSYMILILISALLVLIGILFHSASGRMYLFARYLMGIAQSPIVIMILIPTFIVFQKEFTNQSKE